MCSPKIGRCVRAVWGRGGYTAPRSPHHSCSTPPRARAPGHELRGKQSTWTSTCETGEPVDPFTRSDVEPRKGYETLQSVHGTELKHPNQGDHVRERFVNSLDPFGATLTSFTFGAPKALPRGARLRSRRERKAPPSSIHCSTKRSAKGIALGGMRS